MIRKAFLIQLFILIAYSAFAQSKEDNNFIELKQQHVPLTRISVLADTVFPDEAYMVDTTKIYDIAEFMPEFPGGFEGLTNYIRERIHYTEAAKRDSIQGRVVLRLTIGRQGDVENIELKRKIHPDCDSIAVDIARSMPRWSPAIQSSVPVKVYYHIPIFFKREKAKQ
ncbi:energy transducer TonB [Dysgonomonas sp. 25]|uniref:energy transducer TonB n=1 Tax=Dysgonomonas sp. 25 TaxID=2302933 RepID=UPI0013D47C0E|nr:energy transducer TonB [Dysgonomonas sp. 25]NDV69263.1 energy transducer TonB [Dysgonomonas sp. 25]